MTGIDDYLSFRVDLDAPEAVLVYDELPLWSAGFGRLLLDRIPMRRGTTVLDLGYGTGFPILELAQRLGDTSRVIGIDPWETARQRALLKARVWNVRNAELLCGDAHAMPFPDGQFDLVVSNLGVNNFADPPAVLRECRRVMKNDARLALTTNLQGHMRELYEVYEATLVELGRSDLVPGLQRHVAHRATLEGLADLFARSGLRLSATHSEVASMRFLDGSALFRHYFVRLGFLDGWKSFVPETDQPAVFARLEKNLNLLAARRGELALTIPMAYVEAVREARLPAA
jgi:arsenite methyltransferase